MSDRSMECIDASSEDDRAPFRFMSLPVEIRLMIYRLLLICDSMMEPQTRIGFKPGKPPQKPLCRQILWSCRAIRNESLAIFFGLNHFHFHPSVDIHGQRLNHYAQGLLGISDHFNSICSISIRVSSKSVEKGLKEFLDYVKTRDNPIKYLALRYAAPFLERWFYESVIEFSECPLITLCEVELGEYASMTGEQLRTTDMYRYRTLRGPGRDIDTHDEILGLMKGMDARLKAQAKSSTTGLHLQMSD